MRVTPKDGKYEFYYKIDGTKVMEPVLIDADDQLWKNLMVGNKMHTHSVNGLVRNVVVRQAFQFW